MSGLAVVAVALLAVQSGAGSVAGGEQIYREGLSPRGTPITANVGSGDALPAALLPCVNCHGADGRGRSEGGVRPADISPAALARPLQNERRQRPAYDAIRLRRAITMGIDAGGQPLDLAMPRYGLSLADAQDLQTYLAQLDQRHEPGVTDQRLRIGVRGAALTAPAQEIYGRRVELVALAPAAVDTDLLLLIDMQADGSASLAAADEVPTIVFAAAAEPGRRGFVVTASAVTLDAALQALAGTVESPLQLRDCSEAAALTTAHTLLFNAAVAARCDLQQLPWPPGQSLRIALPAPPDAALRQTVAAAVLDLVVDLLQQTGRDLSRETLAARLEAVQARRLGPLPPLRWSSARRHGLDQVWLLRLDSRDGRLQPAPGWFALP